MGKWTGCGHHGNGHREKVWGAGPPSSKKRGSEELILEPSLERWLRDGTGTESRPGWLSALIFRVWPHLHPEEAPVGDQGSHRRCL